MKKVVDNFRFFLKQRELVPLIIGGMGVDISTERLALEAARLGGIGHISDAMSPTVTDRHYKTTYSKDKLALYKDNKFNFDKAIVKFDLEKVKAAQKLYVSKVMEKKKGLGMVFINCMEKLTMNDPKGTLKARLEGALDGGIEGITLSAGLHASTLSLIRDHKRYKDVCIGIIVSSVRALKIFLSKAQKEDREPDYIIVEGPLAGGHLGFGFDWDKYTLKSIFNEVQEYIKEIKLKVPLIAAGGIFTGSDAVDYLESGAHAVQLATRFTITNESGLPDRVKQNYFKASESDVIVSNCSPTGYPMRILKDSPGLTLNIRPNCETYGYLLNAKGQCAYIDAYKEASELAKKNNEKYFQVKDKVCLCTHMRDYKIWTCGHYVYRLKDTSLELPNGDYQLLSAEHVFNDYLYSDEHNVQLPEISA